MFILMEALTFARLVLGEIQVGEVYQVWTLEYVSEPILRYHSDWNNRIYRCLVYETKR